jgi:acyl-CoA thioester hydrolase
MHYRVCYADTDAGGVVYHATYLSIFERGRTEFLRERGVSIRELHDNGTIFPVIRIEIDFKAAALLDDLLRIETTVTAIGRTSFTLRQRCLRDTDGTLLVAALVTLVCVAPGMKPKRLPPDLAQLFQELREPETP